MAQTFKKINATESEWTISVDNHPPSKILMKEIGAKIYWKCNGEYILSHSLDGRQTTGSCYSVPPVLNSRIKLNGKRTYRIGNKKYQVYSFGENTGSDSDIATYYLKNSGFICYYVISNKSYYFLSGDSTMENLPSSDIEHLRQILIRDTSFFAAYNTKVSDVRITF